MKRIVKFRGKRLTDGKWIYGDFFRNRGLAFITTDEIVENPLASWQDYNVDPDTVGQFTGIYDRKGSEIYEGDIVRTSVSKNGIALVEWHCEHAAFVVHMKGSDQWYHLYKGYEKIGNIHDNPFLLEGGLKCFTL